MISSLDVKWQNIFKTKWTSQEKWEPNPYLWPALPCVWQRAAAAPWGRAVQRWVYFTTCALTQFTAEFRNSPADINSENV